MAEPTAGATLDPDKGSQKQGDPAPAAPAKPQGDPAKPQTPEPAGTPDLTKLTEQIKVLNQKNEDLEKLATEHKKESEGNRAQYKQMRDVFSVLSGDKPPSDDQPYDAAAAVTKVVAMMEGMQKQIDEQNQNAVVLQLNTSITKVASEKGVPSCNVAGLMQLYSQQFGKPDPENGSGDVGKSIDDLIVMYPMLLHDSEKAAKETEEKRLEDEAAKTARGGYPVDPTAGATQQTQTVPQPINGSPAPLGPGNQAQPGAQAPQNLAEARERALALMAKMRGR